MLARAATFPASRTGLKARRIAEALEEYPTPAVVSTASLRNRHRPCPLPEHERRLRALGRYIGPWYVAFLFWMRIRAAIELLV